MTDRSLSNAYFDEVYAADDDPWKFESSDYERAKYAVTLAALPRVHYEAAFEIGCSIGVLTLQLAARCAHLLAVDVSGKALARARSRCAELRNIEFAPMRIPDELPARSFDLIVVSEVAYYWSMADLSRASAWMISHLERGGCLLLVHWTPPVADYPLSGDHVHEYFLALAHAGLLRHLHGERHELYRLDAFTSA